MRGEGREPCCSHTKFVGMVITTWTINELAISPVTISLPFSP